MDHTKYLPFEPPVMAERRWPKNTITKAPIWCSVDLRDGNQALEVPMNLSQKLEFFNFLVRIGFKEIEVGFPAASDTEFEFVRTLIERDMIPEDVTIQVLTQSREHIIRRTFEAVAGVKKAIVHLYNSTSTLQRDVVFGKSMAEVKEIAVSGAKQMIELAEKYGRERFGFEYSPESFTQTEPDYAAEVVNAVLEVLRPTAGRKVIINLPSTMEMSTPNVYADQIEYVTDRINRKENVIISLHAHNDRGTAVASTELALLAGATRVEGTLFGNGERTGNADIINLALNLYTQGIEPGLDFSEIDEAIKIYEQSTGLFVHPRHPYAGSLVFTAFSGSHQDAINKGMSRMLSRKEQKVWSIPYLHIDPKDIGRDYDPIIRINSQSGKGGVAYVLSANYGIILPKAMQPELGTLITGISDERNRQLTGQEIYEIFRHEYVNIETPINLISYNETSGDDETLVTSRLMIRGEEHEISGRGSGIIDAFCAALAERIKVPMEVAEYNEHSLDYGSQSRAITYIAVKSGEKIYFGSGISRSITKSSLKALVSAANKLYNTGK